MKRIVAGLALMLAVSLGANAQDNQDMKKHRKGQHQKSVMYQELGLTDSQKQQMQSLQADFKSKMTELNKNENITVKEMKEKRSAIVKEHRSAVDNILTAEQKTKMKEMKKNKAGKHARKGGHKVDLTAKLNLTEAQATQMKSVNESFRKRSKEIQSNDQLDAQAKKAQVMNLRKEHKAQVNNILTPEQVQKMNEMRKSRVERNRTR